MNSILGIGVSGLQAAAKRAEVSASNIVNARSEPVKPAGAPGGGSPSTNEFQALQVYQEAVQGGGVKASTRPVDPPSYQVADPFSTDGSGLAYVPNVSYEREFVEQIRAEHAYKASAKVIKTAKEMDDTLLDILR